MTEGIAEGILVAFVFVVAIQGWFNYANNVLYTTGKPVFRQRPQEEPSKILQHGMHR